MKKYIILFLTTLIIVGSIVMSGYALRENIIEVKTFALTPKNAENVLTVSGKAEYAAKKTVTVDSSGVIAEINVKTNDRVKKGDLLFSYYRLDEQYQNMISQYGDVSTILSALSDKSIQNRVVQEVQKYGKLTEIYADYEGVVTVGSVAKDSIVLKDTEVCRISDKMDFEIPVNINESYINQIQCKQKVKIQFSAIPDKTYAGSIVKIADEADQTAGLTGKETTVKVIIKTNRPVREKIRTGYTAECSIVTSTDKNVNIVPYEYIRTDDKGDFVFVVQKHRAKKVYIQTGKEYKEGVQIKKGIQAGEQIIKDYQNIANGSRVKVIGGE